MAEAEGVAAAVDKVSSNNNHSRSLHLSFAVLCLSSEDERHQKQSYWYAEQAAQDQ